MIFSQIIQSNVLWWFLVSYLSSSLKLIASWIVSFLVLKKVTNVFPDQKSIFALISTNAFLVATGNVYGYSFSRFCIIIFCNFRRVFCFDFALTQCKQGFSFPANLIPNLFVAAFILDSYWSVLAWNALMSWFVKLSSSTSALIPIGLMIAAMP